MGVRAVDTRVCRHYRKAVSRERPAINQRRLWLRIRQRLEWEIPKLGVGYPDKPEGTVKPGK